MKVNLMIGKAGERFSGAEIEKIRRGAERAEKFVNGRLGKVQPKRMQSEARQSGDEWREDPVMEGLEIESSTKRQLGRKRSDVNNDVDVAVVANLADYMIAEDKIGAQTFSGNFLLLTLAPGAVRESYVYELLCHELYHATRWQRGGEMMQTMFDSMILEGAAVCFEAEAVKGMKNDEKMVFLRTVLGRSDAENERVLDVLRGELDERYYDYYRVFYAGDEKRGLPKWAGYALGYYLVKKYLEKSGETIENVVAEKFEAFKSVIAK